MQQSVSMNRFAKNMRTLIRARRMTLADVAEVTGMSRPGLSRVINGHESVTLERGERIAAALGATLAEMISEKISDKVAEHA